MAQKFVIVVDKNEYKEYLDHDTELIAKLRLGNVIYHKELVSKNEYCFGGGAFEYSANDKDVLLYGTSGDYGDPRWDFPDKIICETDIAGKIEYMKSDFLTSGSEEKLDLRTLLTFE